MPEGDGDDAGLVEALAEYDVVARWAPWGSPVGPDETVVLRATWDYQDHRERFLDWCASLPKLINPFPVIRSNTDKRYLARLAATGLPVIPTLVHEPGGQLRDAGDDFVIKPAVGAGSRGAGRFTSSQRAEAVSHLEKLHAAGFSALVQPYQQSVDRHGETSLVFFRGAYSHAFTKGPMLTGGVADTQGALYLPESLAEAEPDAEMRAVALACLEGAAADAGVAVHDLVYGRVDLVRGESGPLLLELELTEPGLGFPYVTPGPLRRFAHAISSACS
ncbi:ATP-grasp domain-containing protein [Streptomyces sp. NPDC004126]|uniref:ATP-grasp domain-containing protein n=1 Tax=Streptomyces sp. NPDC004126 TaxID=3390695 RepID=UPI003D041EA7